MDPLARVAREAKFLRKLLRTLGRVSVVDSRPDFLTPDAFERAADRWAERPALKSEAGVLSYFEVEALANRVAAWADEQNLQRGDSVALVMGNRLEYAAIWIGLSKVGVATALINNNLTGAALAHCLSLSDARHVITEREARGAFDTIRQQLPRPFSLWDLDLLPAEETERLHPLRLQAHAIRPPRERRQGMTNRDLALYIYTSGTTGLPKAARITHARVLLYMLGFAGATGARPADRIYSALPLYHATGGVAALGGALFNGACFVMRRKFSASHFWDDLRAERATMFVYIGELCRYLLNQPARSDDGAHELRLAFGNGLRPEVWAPFQKRFRVPDILEFYGSTEGNVSLFNFDGAPGAVGRIPFYVRKRFNVRLIKLDLETEQPIRGADGLCEECGAGEVGETIGHIGKDVRSNYTGYVDKAASEKKVLHDVMTPGDAWFRTGDLMRMDADGYLYFVDRLGDTFRWKGENVSTTEVAAALSGCVGVTEANVYGVAIPGYDGRAGMAALITAPAFRIETLGAHVQAALPAYARPVFIRLQPEIETTGTFKYRKVDLVREGFDPTQIADPLFVYDPAQKAFVPLTAALAAQVTSGALRL